MASKSRDVGGFVVETGMPAPARQSRRRNKYPFVEMRVGESVFISGKTANSLRGSLQYASLKIQGEFVSRSEDGGARVWRTN